MPRRVPLRLGTPCMARRGAGRRQAGGFEAMAHGLRAVPRLARRGGPGGGLRPSRAQPSWTAAGCAPRPRPARVPAAPSCRKAPSCAPPLPPLSHHHHHPLRRFQHDRRAGGSGARGGGPHRPAPCRLPSATAGPGDSWDAGTSTGPSGGTRKLALPAAATDPGGADRRAGTCAPVIVRAAGQLRPCQRFVAHDNPTARLGPSKRNRT